VPNPPGEILVYRCMCVSVVFFVVSHKAGWLNVTVRS
jgi:hypothetical protein